MKSLLKRIRRYLFMLALACFGLPMSVQASQWGTHLSGEPHEATQREWCLTETEYAIREVYYAWQAQAYGSKKQLLQLVKQYNDCKWWGIC